MIHVAGGVKTPLPSDVTAWARYGGANDCLRYLLRWDWNNAGPTLVVGMMNPSCASEYNGDRTVSWCYRWAKSRGFGRLIVVNSEPYRAANQNDIPNRPHDTDNAAAIIMAGQQADMCIMGYGQPKASHMRGKGLAMAHLLESAGVPLRVWELSVNGTPKHPLYLPATVTAKPWKP